jgi:hypothetical protein
MKTSSFAALLVRHKPIMKRVILGPMVVLLSLDFVCAQSSRNPVLAKRPTTFQMNEDLARQLIRDDKNVRSVFREVYAGNIAVFLEQSLPSTGDLIDVNRDGQTEYIVWAPRELAGNRNAPTWLYRKTLNGYELLLLGSNGFKQLTTLTNGYSDLESGGGSGASEHFVTVYKFDGTKYRECTVKHQVYRGNRWVLLSTENKCPSSIQRAPRNRSKQQEWNSFWSTFRAAVSNRDRAALVTMMSARFDSGGDGAYSPDAWIKLMDRNSFWPMTQKAVSSGTRLSRANNGRPIRVTNDMYLFFERGPDARWRWAGIVGD